MLLHVVQCGWQRLRLVNTRLLSEGEPLEPPPTFCSAGWQNQTALCGRVWALVSGVGAARDVYRGMSPCEVTCMPVVDLCLTFQ